MKKVISIILVMALLLSFAGCDGKAPSKTPVPTVAPATVAPTNAPETEAPTVEPTVAPETEAPETEEPQKEGWITLAKPMGPTVTAPQIEELILEGGETHELKGNKDYRIVLSSGSGETIINGADYTGDVIIESELNDDITINLPKAHVEFSGTAQTLFATTSDTTFVLKTGAEIVGCLTIQGGNAIIEKGATLGVVGIAIDSSNTTDIQVYSNVAEVEVRNASAEGVIVTVGEDAETTIVNKAEGTKVVAKDNAVVTIDTQTGTADTYIKNETSADGGILIKKDDNAAESAGDITEGLVSTDGTVVNKGVVEVSTAAEFLDEIEKGSNIKLMADFSVDVASVNGNSVPAIDITVDGTTIDGNGKTITAVGNVTSGGSFINVTGADNVEIKNLTLVGGKITNLKHGINAYESSNVSIDNVTIKNFSATGLTVNGANVTANDLTISGCGWGCVNVDPGSGVSAKTVFTLTGNSTLNANDGTAQIWSDGNNVTTTATVTVNAEGYTEVSGDGNAKGWTNVPQA